MSRLPRLQAPPRGQATVEYISVSAVLMLGTLVAFTGWPLTRLFFEAMQSYVDLFFYALNVAVG